MEVGAEEQEVRADLAAMSLEEVALAEAVPRHLRWAPQHAQRRSAAASWRAGSCRRRRAPLEARRCPWKHCRNSFVPHCGAPC